MVTSVIKRMIINFRLKNINVKLDRSATTSLQSQFEGANRIGRGTSFFGSIGYGSYIGDHCYINAQVGKFTCIGPRVITTRGSHPTKTWVSIHPAFYSLQQQCGMTFVSTQKYKESGDPIIIGNDVWIGDSATLTEGINIGDGAVVAAGAVVTKNVEPYSIVGGVPAKLIRYRFEDFTIIETLLSFRWWDQPIEWIITNADAFENIEKFLDVIENKNLW